MAAAASLLMLFASFSLAVLSAYGTPGVKVWIIHCFWGVFCFMLIIVDRLFKIENKLDELNQIIKAALEAE